MQRHVRGITPLPLRLFRLGRDFALFTSVLLAWPVLRLGRVLLPMRRRGPAR